MNAPTAQGIIRALDRQRFQADMGQLAALDSAHSEAVRAALAAVPGKSRIDLRVLLDSVRREVAEQAAKRPAGRPWRYAVTLMNDAQVAEFRRLVESGTDPDAAAGRVMAESAIAARLDGIAERMCASGEPSQPDAEPDPDDELDDEPRPKRRGVPRRRLRRAVDAGGVPAHAKAPAPAPAEHHARQRPSQEPRRPFFIGPRAFGPGTDEYDPYTEHFKPPWLLPDDPDESDKEEIDHVDYERAHAAQA